MADMTPIAKAARRDRGADAQQTTIDTVASSMAAAGLGLALWHLETPDATSHAAAAAAAPTPGQAGTAHAAQMPDAAPPPAAAHEAAQAHPPPASPTGEMPVMPGHDAGPDGGHAGAPVMHDDMAGILSAAAEAQGHAPAGAGSPAPIPAAEPADTGHHMEALIPALHTPLQGAADTLAHGLSALQSGVGELVAGHGPGALADAAASLVADTLAAPAAIVAAADPVFHQAFGPASDALQATWSGVIDTGGLAAYGDPLHALPIGFLGQSYTEAADHALHGLPSLTHGLV